MNCTICHAPVAMKTHEGLWLCSEHKATQAEAVQPLGAMRMSAIEDSIERLSEKLLRTIQYSVAAELLLDSTQRELANFLNMTFWQRLKWFFRGIR